jgi:hypothetical protein
VSQGRGSTGSSFRERALGEGPEVLLSLDLSTWVTALADPLVLTLELWALALSCCAGVAVQQHPQQQQHQQQLASSGTGGIYAPLGHAAGSRAGSSSGAAAEPVGLAMLPQLCAFQQHQQELNMGLLSHGPTTAGQVLASVFSHVLPVAAAQAAVWAITAGPLADAAAAAAQEIQQQQPLPLPRLCQVLCVWCEPENATINGSDGVHAPQARQLQEQEHRLLLGHVSAQLLPLLVRVYIMQCAAEGAPPREDLIKRYTALVPVQLPKVQPAGVGSTGQSARISSQAQDSVMEAAAEASEAITTLASDLCSMMGVQSVGQALSSIFATPQSAAGVCRLSTRISRWCRPLLAALKLAKEAAQGQHQGSPGSVASRGRPTGACRTAQAVPGLPVPPSLIPLPPLFQDLYLQLAQQVRSGWPSAV